MPDPLYTRLQATANRLIAQYGKAAVVTRSTVTGPGHDPVLTPVEYDVTLVETGYRLTNRDSTLIQTGDKLGLISVAGETQPQKGDKLTIEGDVYAFVELEPLNPGGLTLLYEFQARR
tara:strand:+ start:20601 stop:20954 length:354 start_codon:yes stop_codon:yes gene_type:complete